MPDFRLEDDVSPCAGARVAGVDEVGRGPLAGPVVAAAVVLDRTRLPDDLRARIDDSKRLTAQQRSAVAEALSGVASIGVGWVERRDIDRLNILWATMLAMQRAVADLIETASVRVDVALVDGNRVPDLPCPAIPVVKGDGRSLSIAAASIIAKVARDARMADLARRYPGYGWDRNAGYGTAEHRAALKALGVTPEHRRGFGPVRALLKPEPPEA